VVIAETKLALYPSFFLLRVVITATKREPLRCCAEGVVSSFADLRTFVQFRRRRGWRRSTAVLRAEKQQRLPFLDLTAA
jgi:hypothetical protein